MFFIQFDVNSLIEYLAKIEVSDVAPFVDANFIQFLYNQNIRLDYRNVSI